MSIYFFLLLLLLFTRPFSRRRVQRSQSSFRDSCAISFLSASLVEYISSNGTTTAHTHMHSTAASSLLSVTIQFIQIIWYVAHISVCVFDHLPMNDLGCERDRPIRPLYEFIPCIQTSETIFATRWTMHSTFAKIFVLVSCLLLSSFGLAYVFFFVPLLFHPPILSLPAIKYS